MKNARKVLLVENDEFTRYMMREIITALGVDVELAEDGEEGVSKVIENPGEFGLVLMDLHMPNVSGLEATRQIRAMASAVSDTPIVALTADAMETARDACTEAGMNAVITKPIRPDILFGTLEEFTTARPDRPDHTLEQMAS